MAFIHTHHQAPAALWAGEATVPARQSLVVCETARWPAEPHTVAARGGRGDADIIPDASIDRARVAIIAGATVRATLPEPWALDIQGVNQLRPDIHRHVLFGT